MTTEERNEKLKALCEHIVEHHEEFDMAIWAGKGKCGTVGCLAGTACMMAGYEPIFTDSVCTLSSSSIAVRHRLGEEGEIANYAKKKDSGAFGVFDQVSISTTAAMLLGLAPDEQSKLFLPSVWPARFQLAYRKAAQTNDTQKMACVTAERVKHFIDTGA